MKEQKINFPRLIRYNNKQSGSSKRLLMKSQEQKSDNNEILFKITDLKRYEKEQLKSYEVMQMQTKVEVKNIPKNDCSSVENDEISIIQQKMQGRKLNQQSMFDVLPIQIKEFYQGKQEVITIIEDFGIINDQMNSLIETVKCYRYEVGTALQRISSMFFKILEKTLEINIKDYNEKKKQWEQQIKEEIQRRGNLENELKQLEENQKYYKNLIKYHESEYRICKSNSDGLQNEIIMLHELIKKDLFEMITRMDQLEQKKIGSEVEEQQITDDPSQQLVYNLNSLTKLIQKIENEQKGNESHIYSMNGLLKAMLKGGKQDAYTQLDEGELLVSANYLNQKKLVPIEGNAFLQEDNIQLSTNVVTQWRLSGSLVQFLSNVIRENENGRVLPWPAFRAWIYKIYQQRLEDSIFIQSCVGGNQISLDEYLCLSVLRQYKTRRIAEIKLLEFLVSLKYYMKTFIRASIFGKLIGVIPLNNESEQQQTDSQITYKLDIFLVQFYLFCFQTVKQLPAEDNIIENEMNGITYLNIFKAFELINQLIPFAQESQKQKVRKKIEKNSTAIKTDEVQAVDLDQFLTWVLQEYLDSRKSQVKLLQKSFNKEIDGGICDVEDFFQIVEGVQDKINPQHNQIAKLRGFYHSLTSGANTFKISTTQFLLSCNLYGLDSPFTINSNSSLNTIITKLYSEFSTQFSNNNASSQDVQQLKHLNSSLLNASRSAKRSSILSIKKTNTLTQREESYEKDKNILPKSPEKDKEKNESQEKDIFKQQVQPLSIQQQTKMTRGQLSLLAQHFSILRELKNYCNNFKRTIEKEQNVEMLWKNFQDINKIIESACTFLNFPLISQK